MKNWLNKHRQAAPANTAQPPATAGDDSALILRDLMSPDGYARERALHQLAPAQVNGPVLSAVLLRLNDWVPQVRQAAQEVLRQLSAGLGFEQLQAVLPALQALERGRRADHSESLDLIRRSLTLQVQGMSEAQRQRLHDLARRGAPVSAAFAFDVLLNWAKDPSSHPQQALPAVLATGLQARQPAISRRAVQWVNKLAAPAQMPLYVQALRSRHARTRTTALRALGRDWHATAAQALPVPQLPDWLRTCLLDANASARYLALTLCGGPSAGLLAHAQAVLQAPTATARERCAALGLLADAASADPPLARTWANAALQDPRSSVRRAAYATALQLHASDASATEALLLLALADPANKVFAAAVRHVQHSGQSPTLTALAPHLQGSHAAHWRRVLQLTTGANPWDRLIALLCVPHAALAEPGPDGGPNPHALALRQVGPRWLAEISAHCFVPPSPAQQQHIARLLPQAPVKTLLGGQRNAFISALKDWGMATGLNP